MFTGLRVKMNSYFLKQGFCAQKGDAFLHLISLNVQRTKSRRREMCVITIIIINFAAPS